jgi:hypothetical protein
MALTDDFAAALNPVVQAQVKTALYAYASGIISETPQPTDHTQRLNFATTVLNGSANFDSLILATCAFASLTSTSSDTTVSNAVAALWSAFAGG